MPSALLNRLRDAYDPDPRATGSVLLGSKFVLTTFLLTADFGNPYYVFGLTGTLFAAVASATMLAVDRWR